MNILSRNDIAMTLSLAYVGVTKGWVSVEEVLREISPDELGTLSNDLVASLYSSAGESKDAFLSIVAKIANIDDDTIHTGLHIWSIAYLGDIMQSYKTITEKLEAVADVWVMFNCPLAWNEFVYYMPAAGGMKTGMDAMYKKFVEFMKNEKLKLHG